MSTESPTAVRVYLARVRTALADLPSTEVEEILEDVRPHLSEIEAELGPGARVEALIAQLGTPENYAAELRAAGDYPPAGPVVATSTVAQKRGRARFVLWSLGLSSVVLGLSGLAAGSGLRTTPLVTLVVIIPLLGLGVWYLTTHGTGRIVALPEVRWVRETLAKQDQKVIGYIRSLSAAWWLLCAAAMVLFALLLIRRGSGGLLALPFLVLAAVAVVWGGRKITADKRWLWLSLPVSLFVLGSSIGLSVYVFDSVNRYQSYGAVSYPANRAEDGSPALYYGTTPVENIYAFDAEGKPLTDVYLYDAEGRPITLSRYSCEPGPDYPIKVGADNRFPRPRIETGITDNSGHFNGYNGYRPACRETTGVPFAAAIPKPPATSASPSETPSPSATPSPSVTTPPPSPSTQPTR